MTKLALSDLRKINESLNMINEELVGMVMPYGPGKDFDEDDDWSDDEEEDEEPAQGFEDLDSEEEGDDDLGSENDLDQAMAIAFGDADPDGGDLIDQALMALVDEVAQEYEEESAISAVYDAIEDLYDENAIEEMPTESDPDGFKIDWLQNSMAKIRAKLQSFGIELEAGAETTGGNKY